MTKEWRCFHCDELFTDREVTDEQIEMAYNAVMVVARAFYRDASPSSEA